MGAVEIYHDDQWMAVCDDGFNGLAARVVCQTLGYKEGVVVLGSAFGETTGPIRVRRIDCGGNEKDLFDCNFEFTDKPMCKKYISVYCSNVQIWAIMGGEVHVSCKVCLTVRFLSYKILKDIVPIRRCPRHLGLCCK